MSSPEKFDPHLLSLLACPRDKSALQLNSGALCCQHGHVYPIVGGIPIFVLPEKTQTIGIAAESLKALENPAAAPLYVETLGLSDEQRARIIEEWSNKRTRIDPVVSYLIGATSGYAYAKLVGRLERYPIPDIPIGAGAGRTLLDVGSNWGRWSVSAARKGWRVVGIDPSLGALLAAKRAFLDATDVSFVCGDARFLPFKPNAFEGIFSYSVLQHFSEPDVLMCVGEFGRVLRPRGFAKIQMAHKGGLRSRYIRSRSNYLSSGPFRVRYWSLKAMQTVFERAIGPSVVVPEAFGGLGLLSEDKSYVPTGIRFLISMSSLLKELSSFVRPLIRLADSVYVVSTKPSRN
jgi:ubiquinone/menaquinone biosynthesis C-methylase UbiE/uncharacterized protein YbaR (Trm112 family)